MWKALLIIVAFLLFNTGCVFSDTNGRKTLPYLGDAGETQSVIDSGSGGGSSSVNQAVVPAKGAKITVVLYFADNNGYLVAARREVPKVEGIARLTLQELCRGPLPGSELNPTIPPGTVLRDINIKSGLATVDFSQDLKSKHWGGSTGELLTVYSIVNTLTQFPSVEKVQILVEGQCLPSLAGHLDISRPLERESSLIRAVK